MSLHSKDLERGKHILVVEDEPLIRMATSDFLEQRGFLVFEASTAEEAIRVLASQVEIDLVFTDVRMPGTLDGLDLARYVAKYHPNIPVLLTSGHVVTAELPDCLTPLIEKPYAMEDVAREINRKIRCSVGFAARSK